MTPPKHLGPRLAPCGPIVDVYVTHSPCIHCMKVLINTGIKTVFYGQQYKFHTITELIARARVKLVEVHPVPHVQS